jgi:hypothetical protein
MIADDPQPFVGKDGDHLRAILERLRSVPGNPVTRARHLVEMQVPLSRRGPGWDRHWRELEAYLDTPGDWSGLPHEGEQDDELPEDEA